MREIGRSSGGEVSDLAWSPDGRWLVWAEPNSWQLSRLMISDTEAQEPTGRALTSGKFQDSAPAFSADGEHLALLSPVSYTHLTLPTIAAECRSRWSPYH